MKKIPINTKEKSDKLLLSVEIVLGIFSTILLVGSILIAVLCFMSIVPGILIISTGVICFVVGMFTCLKIEQLQDTMNVLAVNTDIFLNLKKYVSLCTLEEPER